MRQMETSRLVIRDFLPSDARDLYEILGDEETMAYSEPPYTLEGTRTFLESFCIGRKGALAAVHKESGKLIGYLLFNQASHGVYEMGWFFNRQFWGRGYAFEACAALIDQTFRRWDAHKIFAETIDGVKSVGLMKKLGMRLEGIQRGHVLDLQESWADLYLYGILREEWEA